MQAVPMTTLFVAAMLFSAATSAQTAESAVMEASGPGRVATLDRDALKALPQASATLTFGAPAAAHVFTGPLLFAALADARIVDPARHGAVPRQTLRIQGVDGYVAILAMGEISPEFEGKPAILAVAMDGQALAQPRVIVPNDRRAGRSVRDVVRLSLDESAK